MQRFGHVLLYQGAESNDWVRLKRFFRLAKIKHLTTCSFPLRRSTFSILNTLIIFYLYNNALPLFTVKEVYLSIAVFI